MLNLYTETAAQACPATPSAVLNFTIPRKNGSYDRSKYSSPSSNPHTSNEKDYADHQLAVSGNIYFRESKTWQPRSVFWRLVGEGKTLELLPTDLSRSEDDTQEAHLTLRFSFQDPILPAGVAIADSDVENELHVFVCTTKNEVFHLRIQPDAFRSPDAIPTDVSQWCSALEISSLAIDTVFRLHAHSPFEIVISYISGKLQRLQRKRESTTWIPENYDDKTWGASIRGIVGRGPLRSIEHGSLSVDTRAVQAMRLSPDSNYLFTVCLNHQLRVWHLASGKLAVATDLLDKARNPHDKIHLNPSEAGHLQLYKLDHMRSTLLITYSAHEGGQFKFWDVKGGLTDPLSVEDRYPTLKLTPPDPDPSGNTIWSLAGFHIVPCAVDPINSVRIWVLWRNNNHHHLYTTRFVLNDPHSSWKTEWVSCLPDASKKSSPPDLIKSGSDDITSNWLAFLLSPGRYTPAVLETALAVYSDAVSARPPSSQKKLSGLKARLCAVIANQVSLRKYDQTVIDYDRFATDTDFQWRSFWRIVEKINDGRHAPLTLCYDLFTAQPWIVMADKVIAVRECDSLEVVSQNEAEELDDVEEISESLWTHRKVVGEIRGIPLAKLSHLIVAAGNFSASFPPELSSRLEIAVEEDLLTSPEQVISSRILEIYEDVGFGDAVSDDIFHRLQKDFKPLGELETISDDLILAVLDLLPTSATVWNKHKHIAGDSHLQSTLFGLSILASGTLEMMLSTRQMLFDLMVLIIFIEGELNQDDDGEKISTFDASELFTLLSKAMKTLDRNIWLATHTRSVPVEFDSSSAQKDQTVADKTDSSPLRTVSILENTLSRAIRPRPAGTDRDVPNTYLLTETLHEIQDWVAGEHVLGFDNGSIYLLCDLLVHQELTLAAEFLKFLPSTPWGTYVRGRVFLAKRQFDFAAQLFREASYGMALGKAVGELDTMSAGLLSETEVEGFNNGMPRYLGHVMALFESVGAYDQAAVFGKIALTNLNPGAGTKDPSSEFRADILKRLFTASLESRNFEASFSTLAQFPDLQAQKSSATKLISAILDTSTSANALSQSVTTLQSLAWTLHPVLQRELDTHLLSLAKKQRTVSVSVSVNGEARKGFTALDGSVDYLKILHAMLVRRGDYRCAVAVLYDRLRLMRKSGRGGVGGGKAFTRDPSMRAIRQVLLALINAMSLVEKEEAYILVEPDESQSQQDINRGEDTGVNGDRNGNGNGHPLRKRRKIIITLEDLRRDYQRVLDRCARVERGDFGFDVDDDGSDDDGGENEGEGEYASEMDVET
jgi:nuclear pore complex protein Nup160